MLDHHFLFLSVHYSVKILKVDFFQVEETRLDLIIISLMDMM